MWQIPSIQTATRMIVDKKLTLAIICKPTASFITKTWYKKRTLQIKHNIYFFKNIIYLRATRFMRTWRTSSGKSSPVLLVQSRMEGKMTWLSALKSWYLLDYFFVCFIVNSWKGPRGYLTRFLIWLRFLWVLLLACPLILHPLSFSPFSFIGPNFYFPFVKVKILTCSVCIAGHVCHIWYCFISDFIVLLFLNGYSYPNFCRLGDRNTPLFISAYINGVLSLMLHFCI